MMGSKQEAQASVLYVFSLEEHIPQDLLLRSIDRFVDLSSLSAHLADFYSHMGRPLVILNFLIWMLLVSSPLILYHRFAVSLIRFRALVGACSARDAVCQACPFKAKYCPNADARKVTCEEHGDAHQGARDLAKPDEYAIAVNLHKKVEMLFAHLKRSLGLGRLRLRDPCGANGEFLLAATAQNLHKLSKIFPAPQQPRKA